MNAPISRVVLSAALITSIIGSHLLSADSAILAPEALNAASFRVASGDIGRELSASGAEAEAARGLRKFEVNTRGMDFHAAQLILPVSEAIAKGDTLSVSFEARTSFIRDESGQGLVTVYFQKAAPPWMKFLFRPVPLTDEWTTYRFAFRIEDAISPKDPAELGFGLGGREQTVELANVILSNHGADVDPASLPQTRATYEGREISAPWREEAAKRIDRIRKADLQIQVVDAQGAPVSGATVSVKQRRHAFLFGSAVSVAALNNPSADGDRYREKVSELFNYVVIESALKWPSWIGEHDFSGEGSIEDGLQWLNDQDLRIKGHVLLWPSFQKMPKSISAMKNDPEALSAAIRQRITGAVKQYQPYLNEWDVVNEPFDKHDAMDLLGEGALAEWFEVAKDASPKPQLYLNDYGVLTGGDANNTAHRQHYEETIASLLKKGAPLDGIGFQGHFGEQMTPPVALYQVLDRFARFGLPIQVSEFDIDSADEELQADYTRDFMTLIFSHPQVSAFVMWGFWEGRHWRPKAALFSKDWKLKPNGKVYQDLVFKEWWTEATGTSSATGEFQVRAFLGDYEIGVEYGGLTTLQDFQLRPGHRSVLVRLPEAE